VHNFTTQPRILPQGQEFISVEFNRTTRLPQCVEQIKSQDELVSLGLKNELRGFKNRSVKIFYKDLERYKARNRDFTPRLFWDKFPGEKHESAMLGTERRLDKVQIDVNETVRGLEERLERRFNSLRNVGFLAGLGLIVGLLGILLGILLPILYAEYGKTREVTAQHQAEIVDLRERLLEQKKLLEALTPRPPVSAPTASPSKP
jgi:hypothetical protein